MFAICIHKDIYFDIVAILGCLILIPTYGIMHDKQYTIVISNLSKLDLLTIIDCMANSQVIILSIIFTVLFSLTAYFFLFGYEDYLFSL